jgi:hypothetical protein
MQNGSNPEIERKVLEFPLVPNLHLERYVFI